MAKTFFVVATGESLANVDINKLRDFHVVVVSNAYELAPWADAMVSTDAAWWKHNTRAYMFKGLKFSTHNDPKHEIKALGGNRAQNSGLLGIRAAKHLGADRIILLGFDMKGTHYFGKHPTPLQNTSSERFEVFKKHIAAFDVGKTEVFNANLNSGLTCYTFCEVFIDGEKL